jgi:hypothetical protein
MAQNPNLAALSAAGVSVWLDDLSRDRLRSGNLQQLIDTRSIVGVTTNPSIFQAALSKGTAYDAQVAELAERGADVDAVIRTATTDDVREACDVLRPQWNDSNGVDGRVSIEVDPRLAHETDKTVLQAIELWKIVDRPNLLIKIPATRAGLPRCRRLVVNCEMPTVVSLSPRTSGGSMWSRITEGPVVMTRTAAAHCVRASAVVRHRPAIATSASMTAGSGAAVPPWSVGTNPASRPARASSAKLPLRHGPTEAEASARRPSTWHKDSRSAECGRSRPGANIGSMMHGSERSRRDGRIGNGSGYTSATSGAVSYPLLALPELHP